MSSTIINPYNFASAPIIPPSGDPLYMNFNNNLNDAEGNYTVDESNLIGVTYPQGRFGTGVSFDAGTNFITVGNSGDFAPVNGRILIEMYVLFGNNNQPLIKQLDNNGLGWSVYVRNRSGGFVLQQDSDFRFPGGVAGRDIFFWRLLSVQFNGGVFDYWVEGEHLRTLNNVSPSLFGAGQLAIGLAPNPYQEALSSGSQLDELYIGPGEAPYTSGVNFIPGTVPRGS